MDRIAGHPELLERFSRFVKGRNFQIEAHPGLVRITVSDPETRTEFIAESYTVPAAVDKLLDQHDSGLAAGVAGGGALRETSRQAEREHPP